MKIGIVGTGAIAAKHAQAWSNIGCPVVACANKTEGKGREFASRFGARFIPSAADLCRDPEVGLVDVCTFPDYRLEPVAICAEIGKPVQLQKPVAATVEDARQILAIARAGGITAGVVSQRRFDPSSQFLYRALKAGRLGRILQADCYVKWYRPPSYYSRAIKGSWKTEGGGALINQAIHQIDVIRWLVGPVKEVYARWRLGAIHAIQSEDLIDALITFENGALGVVQASTAIFPGYPERVEIHGTRGSAIVTGDRLTAWDVENDGGEPAPLARDVSSGASDPMAISLTPFELQFQDFLDAYREKRQPLVSIGEGIAALEIVAAAYRSCRSGLAVSLASAA